MTKEKQEWEHKEVTSFYMRETYPAGSDIKCLNLLGEKGWQLVSVDVNRAGDEVHRRYYLKRPKQ